MYGDENAPEPDATLERLVQLAEGTSVELFLGKVEIELECIPKNSSAFLIKLKELFAQKPSASLLDAEVVRSVCSQWLAEIAKYQHAMDSLSPPNAFSSPRQQGNVWSTISDDSFDDEAFKRSQLTPRSPLLSSTRANNSVLSPLSPFRSPMTPAVQFTTACDSRLLYDDDEDEVPELEAIRLRSRRADDDNQRLISQVYELEQKNLNLTSELEKQADLQRERDTELADIQRIHDKVLESRSTLTAQLIECQASIFEQVGLQEQQRARIRQLVAELSDAECRVESASKEIYALKEKCRKQESVQEEIDQEVQVLLERVRSSEKRVDCLTDENIRLDTENRMMQEVLEEVRSDKAVLAEQLEERVVDTHLNHTASPTLFEELNMLSTCYRCEHPEQQDVQLDCADLVSTVSTATLTTSTVSVDASTPAQVTTSSTSEAQTCSPPLYPGTTQTVGIITTAAISQTEQELFLSTSPSATSSACERSSDEHLLTFLQQYDAAVDPLPCCDSACCVESCSRGNLSSPTSSLTRLLRVPLVVPLAHSAFMLLMLTVAVMNCSMIVATALLTFVAVVLSNLEVAKSTQSWVGRCAQVASFLVNLFLVVVGGVLFLSASCGGLRSQSPLFGQVVFPHAPPF